jgi:DNA topoisomerase VI subunit A
MAFEIRGTAIISGGFLIEYLMHYSNKTGHHGILFESNFDRLNFLDSNKNFVIVSGVEKN